eukprot:13678404-Ditylum_brightwellii.AAC.1
MSRVCTIQILGSSALMFDLKRNKTRIEDVCGAAFPEKGDGNNIIGDNNADSRTAQMHSQ